MALFALVADGIVVQLAPAIFPVHSALEWTGDISSVSPAPTCGWSATKASDSWAFAAPAGPTFAQAQAAQEAGITAACDAAMLTGFSSSALGSAHSYGSLATDQSNLTAAAAASAVSGLSSTWTASLWCADSSGSWSFVAHSAAQIQQVLTDWIAARTALQTKLATLKEQIAAATTLAAVTAITWN